MSPERPLASDLVFHDKIIHRTSVYDARTFLNFGRNFMKPGEKPFPFSKIAHAAPQKKQLPQNEPYPSAIAAFSVSKNSFRSRRHFAFHRRPKPNSGHCVFAVWGPSSKHARFIRHRRRVACFPFLGYLRAKSRLTAVALRNAPAGTVPHTPFTRKGHAASAARQSR